MSGVLQGFVTIGTIIALGALLGHLGVLTLETGRVVASLSFWVGSPALLLLVIADSDPSVLLRGPLAASALAAGSTMLVYAVIARLGWRRDAGSVVIGGFTCGYVNSANLGIPIATYVLGDAALVAPVLLMQLLVLQPIGLAVLDAQAARRAGEGASWARIAVTTFTNPLTGATLVGLLLALTGWRLPALIHAPMKVLSGLAIPAMLLAYGVALRLGPGIAGQGRAELALTSTLKLVVHPLIAYAVGRALGLEGAMLFAVVVLGALPTAQNIFILATRYRRAEVLARDTILVTTIGSVPVITLAAALLG